MNEAQAVAPRTSSVGWLPLAMSAALIVGVGWLAYLESFGRRPPQGNSAMKVIEGDLLVEYMLITSKTASSESSSGLTLPATRVEYFPNYVLVTNSKDVTILWSLDRLKTFEVSRKPQHSQDQH
ncbi:MAG: hypothetical protein R3C01_17185 [Planctomycetaceae bacterium]